MLARFRSGCVGVREYLFKTGCADSTYCVYCLNYQLGSKEHYIIHRPIYDNAEDDLKKLIVKIDPIYVSDLLGGAGFSPHKRRSVMKAFCKFLISTGRIALF